MKTLSVTEAKPRLGRLVDDVLNKGRPVILRRGTRWVKIVEHTPPEPIPERAPGYFAADAATVRLRNMLGEVRSCAR